MVVYFTERIKPPLGGVERSLHDDRAFVTMIAVAHKRIRGGITNNAGASMPLQMWR